MKDRAKAQRRLSNSKSQEQKLASPPLTDLEREIDALLDRLMHLRRSIKGKETGSEHPPTSAENGLPSNLGDLQAFLDLAKSCLDRLGRNGPVSRIERVRTRLLAFCHTDGDLLQDFGPEKDAMLAARNAVRYAMIACADVADAELRHAKLDLMKLREHFNNLSQNNHKMTH